MIKSVLVASLAAVASLNCSAGVNNTHMSEIAGYGSVLAGEPHTGDPGWDDPSQTLGCPDGSFAWTISGSNEASWILYDLGSTVLADEARVGYPTLTAA